MSKHKKRAERLRADHGAVDLAGTAPTKLERRQYEAKSRSFRPSR